MRDHKGGGFLDYYPRGTSERKKKKEYKPSCGYVAISNLLNIDIETMKETYQAKIEAALSCQDIMEIVKAEGKRRGNGLTPDCRYCSMKRTSLDLPPLIAGMRGILALKEKGKGNASHWVYCEENNIFTDDGEVIECEGISDEFDHIDGYGHKIVFWGAEESSWLENCYQVLGQKEDCAFCRKQNPSKDETKRLIIL